MIAQNKQTEPHKDHEVIVKRAEPKSPHYGYYHCVTCNKFVTWIDKVTYHAEKRRQLKSDVMWFGVHQGTPISELPQDYLEWAIMNVKGPKVKKLDAEWMKRNQKY